MRWDRSLIFFFCVVGAALALPGVGGAAPEGPALRLVAPAADLRGAPLQVDATGSWVRFSFAPQDGAPALFALGERALRLGPRPDSRLRPPGRVPPPAGLPGACCAVAAGPGEIAVAAADGLRLIGGDGAVRWSAPLPAAATDLNASGDGRLLVAALADGTLRWHAAQDGRLLLSWFPFRDRRRWVAWTPSGYYDAAEGGEAALAWEVGGPGGPARFPAGLFHEQRFRPDVAGRVLFTLDEARAVEETDAEAGRRPDGVPLRRRLPPVVEVLSPRDGSVFSGGSVRVTVALRSPSGERVASLRAVARGRAGLRAAPAALRDLADGTYTLEVDAPAEDAVLAVLAETALSPTVRRVVNLRWEGPRRRGPAPRGDLYVVAVGVGAYYSDGLRLRYPAKDAADLVASLAAQAGRGYRRVEARTLADAQATAAGIRQGLAWLRQRSTPGDVAVLFLAGHGVNDPASGKYYYLPYEAEPGNFDTMLPGAELQQLLAGIPGRKVLFLDTCHAGNVGKAWQLDPARFADALASVEGGVVVFAASTGGQAAREAEQWGNGVFTKALVEGLGGRADLERSGEITVSLMDHYVSRRVAELTRAEQTPTLIRPGTVDFLLARVRPRRPYYKQWWFWGAVGLATAGAITAGVVKATERPTLIFN